MDGQCICTVTWQQDFVDFVGRVGRNPNWLAGMTKLPYQSSIYLIYNHDDV